MLSAYGGSESWAVNGIEGAGVVVYFDAEGKRPGHRAVKVMEKQRCITRRSFHSIPRHLAGE